jgi:hypothetical protein
MASYTESALFYTERLAEVSKRDNTTANCHGVVFHPNGRILYNKKRIKKADAVQTIAAILESEDQMLNQKNSPVNRPSQAGPLTWDRLNQATKDFFFELAGQIMDETFDADFENGQHGARLGKDIPKISLKNAPRLSNLKKAGLLKSGQWNSNTKSERWIWLTEEGHVIYKSHSSK